MAKAKYLEVANELRKRIKQGIYNKQEPLPDQETFAQEFNVSRLTVKKHLMVLNDRVWFINNQDLAPSLLEKFQLRKKLMLQLTHSLV